MSDRFEQICLWTQECIDACAELERLCSEERLALIQLQSERLAQNTFSKQAVVSRVGILRRNLAQAATAWYGAHSVSGLEGALPEQQRAKWTALHRLWVQGWASVQETVRRNQAFLEHSHKNLGRMVEHWRRALGEAPLYSSQGKKVDAPSTGKVITAKY